MALRAGERLGPYEILGGLGAGGMGEVYRARDPRLERPVAIKMLPAAASDDPSRRHRFEHEARAAGQLNHPNILAVHDVGEHEGSPYLVTELLEGETLRERVQEGVLPVRKAVECALQVARGLAAAHDKEIVHRDLKPENLFLTKDGIVKILDFGLARLERVPEPGSEETATATTGTEPGTVMGTVGYMSPEQVRGEAADHRSDLFALGAVLYEMLTGRRAFRRDSSVETLNAILKEEPEEFPPDRQIPPALDRVVRHCLEKKPEDRYQSARDLAFELEGLNGSTARSPARRRRWLLPALGALLALAALAAGYAIARRPASGGALKFQRLTFRRGAVWSARFAPDGQTVVYGASWEGQPIRLFTARPGNVESRPMDLPDADVLAVSRTGELALSLNRTRFRFSGWTHGTLAQVPLGGGAPRALVERVYGADWAPDGHELAVARMLKPRDHTLEYPPGTVLARSSKTQPILSPRVSPGGDLVAFTSQDFEVSVVDRSGARRTLAAGLKRGANSLVWSPKGDEIWFGASFRGDEWAIYAVDLRGRRRVVAELPFASHLHDVLPDGRALVTLHWERGEIWARAPGSAEEKDISWLDWSWPNELSEDGRLLLFWEHGHGGARTQSSYIRVTDGSAPAVLAVQLGGVLVEGEDAFLAPDGSQLVVKEDARPAELRLVPTGPGQERTIRIPPRIEYLPVAADRALRSGWLISGSRFVLHGREPDRLPRTWLFGLDAETLRPITPEGRLVAAISPDGALAVARDESQRLVVYSVAGGEPRMAAGGPETATIMSCSADGKAVFVSERDETAGLGLRVFRRDLATGRRELWKEVRPRDQTGLVSLNFIVSANERAYAYGLSRSFSSLYLVEGLR